MKISNLILPLTLTLSYAVLAQEPSETTKALMKTQGEECSVELKTNNAWKTVRDKVLLETPYSNEQDPVKREKELNEAVYREVINYVCDNFYGPQVSELCRSSGKETVEKVQTFLQANPVIGIRNSDIQSEFLKDTDGKEGICSEWLFTKQELSAEHDYDEVGISEEGKAALANVGIDYKVEVTLQDEQAQAVAAAGAEDILNASLQGEELSKNIEVAQQSQLSDVNRKFKFINDDFASYYSRDVRICNDSSRETWERKVIRISDVSKVPFSVACLHAVQGKAQYEASIESQLMGLSRVFDRVRESFLMSSIAHVGGGGESIEYDFLEFVNLISFVAGDVAHDLENKTETINHIRAVPLLKKVGQKVSSELKRIPNLIEGYKDFYGAEAAQKYVKMAQDIAKQLSPLSQTGLYIVNGRGSIKFVSAEDVRDFNRRYKRQNHPSSDQYKFLRSSDFYSLGEVFMDMKGPVETQIEHRKNGTWNDVLPTLGDHISDPYIFSLIENETFAKGIEVWGALGNRSKLIQQEVGSERKRELSYTVETALSPDYKIDDCKWEQILHDLYTHVTDRMAKEKFIPIWIRPRPAENSDGQMQIRFDLQVVETEKYTIALDEWPGYRKSACQ